MRRCSLVLKCQGYGVLSKAKWASCRTRQDMFQRCSLFSKEMLRPAGGYRGQIPLPCMTVIAAALNILSLCDPDSALVSPVKLCAIQVMSVGV
jgi:hypothetical protein